MSKSGEKTGIVSFHDLAPPSWDLAVRFASAWDQRGWGPMTWLLVPNWYGRFPIDQHPEFCAWVRDRVERGDEVCLHGYTHRAGKVHGGLVARWFGSVYTRSEGEFYQIPLEQAKHRLRSGIELCRRVGLAPTGFTPPAWLLSGEGREALLESGLRYTTTWNYIDPLDHANPRVAPTLVWSSQNSWRRLVSRLWVPFWFSLHDQDPLLRVSVHPADLRYPETQESVWRTLALLSGERKFRRYRDLASFFDPVLLVGPARQPQI